VAERSKATVLKTVARKRRGFESLLLLYVAAATVRLCLLTATTAPTTVEVPVPLPTPIARVSAQPPRHDQVGGR
jgi:hypothetical protein